MGSENRIAARTLKGLAAVAVVITISAFLIVLVADIDNVVGVLTSRDLRTLRGTAVDGRTLETVVGSQFAVKEWRAFHNNELANLTEVECRAGTGDGLPVLLAWEVARQWSPSPEIPRRALLITPLTKAAAELTPQFLPPGFLPSDYPDDRYRLTSSMAVYLRARWKWPHGVPPGR